MAKSFATVRSEAEVVRDESTVNANTATRVGTVMVDTLDTAQAEIANASALKVNTSDINDTLSSTSTSVPLSANQGRVLDEKKVDKTQSIIAGNGLTDGGQLNGDVTLNVAATDDSIVVGANGIKTNTVDALNSTSGTKPLSANQGRALDSAKVNKSQSVIAGNGLTGGGNLSGDVTLNIGATDDSVSIGTDGIKVDTINTLNNTSATKPLSANQGNVLDVKVSGKKPYHGVEAIGNVTFDNSTHVVSLASITYWYKGVKFVSASPVTCDLDSYITLTTNLKYIVYFDDALGVLKASNNVLDMKETVSICMIWWNGTSGAIQREWHNHTRDIDWHINAHKTIGARYNTGFDLIYPTTAQDASLSIGAGSFYDEDLLNSTSGNTTNMRGAYMSSANVYKWADYSLPYIGTTGAPQFLNTSNYTLTAVGTSNFACYWVYATPDTSRPIYVIPTQATASYNTIALAREETPPSLMGLVFTPEIKLLYKLIYKGDGQFQESIDYRTSSSLPSGSINSVAASSVTVIPTGGITSTNVQSALAELDYEATTMENSSLKASSEALNNLLGRVQSIEEYLNQSKFDSIQVNTLEVVENLNMYKLSNILKIGTPRLIGFDFTTGGTFTITTGGVTTSPIVYTNTSTYASVTTQIIDALTAIGKTIVLGYQVINGSTYIILRRDYDALTEYDYTVTDSSGKVKKTATPFDIPDFVGQIYIDNISSTTNAWIAINVNSVSDWKQITN